MRWDWNIGYMSNIKTPYNVLVRRQIYRRRFEDNVKVVGLRIGTSLL
jgi:hypothetical protein